MNLSFAASAYSDAVRLATQYEAGVAFLAIAAGGDASAPAPGGKPRSWAPTGIRERALLGRGVASHLLDKPEMARLARNPPPALYSAHSERHRWDHASLSLR